MKYRGLAGAIVAGGLRDTSQNMKLQFPVFTRGVVPPTRINDLRVGGKSVTVTCAGVAVHPNDIVVADMDGVVVPADKGREILKKAQSLDVTEHSMVPYIEKHKTIREAVSKFGRL